MRKTRGGWGETFLAATAPFPKSRAAYFRFARFNTSALYYLRAWHRLRYQRLVFWLRHTFPLPKATARLASLANIFPIWPGAFNFSPDAFDYRTFDWQAPRFTFRWAARGLTPEKQKERFSFSFSELKMQPFINRLQKNFHQHLTNCTWWKNIIKFETAQFTFENSLYIILSNVFSAVKLPNREIKIHVYGKRPTSDSSWEFLRIENKKIKTVQNNSYV